MARNKLSGLKGNKLSVLLVISLMVTAISGMTNLLAVKGSSPLDLAGYLDFSYGTNTSGEPTGEKPESKLWWNDGFWWGSLFNPTDLKYHIYRLDWGDQNWEDTGVVLDDRKDSKADVLWDNANQKLYVASHVYLLIGSKVNVAANWARFYTFSYDQATQSYTKEASFPVNINVDKTETLVIDKDAAGRFWAVYVSRDPTSITPNDSQVFVNWNNTIGNDASWDTTSFSLGSLFTEAHVSLDDIASVIAFGDKVGVLWSNQLSGIGKFYFAWHNVNDDPATGWTLQNINVPYNANDHINLAKDSSGNVFAAIKTDNPSVVGLLARDAASGVFSFHAVSDLNTYDTRPIVVVNESLNKLYIFNTSKTTGGRICYREAAIVSPLTDISITPANCRNIGNPANDDAPVFIADNNYDNINNATSFKQLANNTTGLVVLASDDLNGQIYVHNVMGNPPPVVTHRFPYFNASNVLLTSDIQATFSKPMNNLTINASTFLVNDNNGLLAGAVSYDSISRTASFTPSIMLKAETVYTATLTSGVQDLSPQPLSLYGAPEQWNFTTELPKVSFEEGSYSVAENGVTANITVTLNSPSSHTVSVSYNTTNGTAIAGTDYTSASGSLTFNPGETIKVVHVPIIDNALPNNSKVFNISLSSPSHAVLGSQSSATVAIIDDDQVLVQFNPPSLNVEENAGFATINVILTKASINTVTVDYATSNGSALAPGDYTLQSGTLTFNPGQVSKSFTVPVIDDALYEADETILLTLSNATGANLGAPDDHGTLTILDNDPVPTVQLSTANYQVYENVGSAVIALTLSDPAGVTSSVSFSATAGTAVAGTDFSPVNTIVTFNPGETAKTVTVPILDDLLSEPDKSVILKLSSPTNAVLGNITNGTLLIQDNDPLPVVQFNQPQITVLESSGTVTITVSLNTASGQTVMVDYSTSNGTAKSGSDYTSQSGTLEFAPGETTKSIVIHITPDTTPEFKETFKVILANPDDIVLGTAFQSTITIDDGSKAVFLPVISK